MSDNVQHPYHYAGTYPSEVIEMIESVLRDTYDSTAFEAYCLGSELKYRFRAGHKSDNPAEDIAKAEKYREFREDAEAMRREREGKLFTLPILDDLLEKAGDEIEDGHGNAWGRWCPDCGAEMEVVRPGKVQCSEGCKRLSTEQGFGRDAGLTWGWCTACRHYASLDVTTLLCRECHTFAGGD